MKKILYRLFTVAIFCFSSLFIQSEISACKIKCKETSNKIKPQASMLKKETSVKPGVPHDGFFIKI